MMTDGVSACLLADNGDVFSLDEKRCIAVYAVPVECLLLCTGSQRGGILRKKDYWIKS